MNLGFIEFNGKYSLHSIYLINIFRSFIKSIYLFIVYDFYCLYLYKFFILFLNIKVLSLEVSLKSQNLYKI